MGNKDEDFEELNRRLESVARGADYPIEAFVFVLRAVPSSEAPLAEPDHIDAEELCWRLHDEAMAAFGKHARERLESWSIRSCSDFGNIVYALVDAGLMEKSDRDCIEDFQGVFDFEDAFQSYARTRRVRRPIQWSLSLLFILTTFAAIAFAGFARLGVDGAIGTLTVSWLSVIGACCLMQAFRDRHRGWVVPACGGLVFLAVAVVMLLGFYLR
jgi:uncharacterized repeat protein (TIGR04138 family)